MMPSNVTTCLGVSDTGRRDLNSGAASGSASVARVYAYVAVRRNGSRLQRANSSVPQVRVGVSALTTRSVGPNGFTKG